MSKNFLKYLLAIILIGFFNQCSTEDCVVIEKFDNNKKRLIACRVSSSERDLFYQRFHEDGSIEMEYSMHDDKINGVAKTFYPSGTVKSMTAYIDGKKTGDSFFYHPDGKAMQFVLNFEDSPVYRKDFYYEEGEKSFTEGFMPILNLEQDSFSTNENKISFTVSLPIPDSLIAGKKFVFAYEAKPTAMRDSIIVNPTNKVTLDNRGMTRCSLEISGDESKIFYGHLYDEVERHIYYPIEKEIYYSGQ